MKPIQVFIFVISVIAGLGAIMLFFPEDGIIITDNFSLQFITPNELFSEEESSLDVDSLLDHQIDIDTLDKLLHEKDSTKQLDIEELKKLINRLEYPDNDSTILWSFFEKLDNINKLGYVRIMHYGDSQIEGDRITSFVRYKLQNKFGGKGYGLNTVGKLYAQFSMIQENSDNWERYTSYMNINEKVKHQKYGVMMAFSRFTPLRDSLEPISETKTKAWIEFTESNLSYTNTREFKQVKLYYGNTITETSVIISINDSIVTETELIIDTGLNVLSYKANNYINNIKFEFESYESPDFYGVSFEDESGIIMDNIGLRGASGTIFNNINSSQLTQMYNMLGVDLFILQFGGNVMPYLETEEQAENHGKYFYHHMLLLKRMVPDAQIIVIGPSDMAIKIKARYVTYPLLEKVIEEMKDATHKIGGAYWDMYAAMGGKNSMKAWVAADPPLASTDHTHFTPTGAQVIANMFYNALILEYSQYQNQKTDSIN
jgi:lysophospholipase L1-like esterase